MCLVKYAFYGVITNKKANELLQEIRQSNTNVTGCVVLYTDRVIILEFASEPTTDELDQLKNTLVATKFEKVTDESTETMPI